MQDKTDLEKVIQQIREMAAKEVEGIFLEALGKLKEEKVVFKQVERDIRKEVMELGGNLLEQAIQIAGKGYVGSSINCSCGGRKRFVNYRDKSLTTLLKEVEFQRAYYHCDRCGKGDVPLDRKMDIVGVGFSPGVREALCFVDAEVSFERGAMFLEQLLDLRVSKQRGEIISEGFGEEINQQLQERKEFLFSQAGSDNVPPHDGEQLYVSADGTMVNTEKGWKEVKVGAVFWAHRAAGGKAQRGPTRYLGGFENSEEFGRRLWAEATHFGLEGAKEVIVLGDGARWIWNEAEMHFPGAIQIVDWYHALEKLWTLSYVIYGEGSKQGNQWVTKLEALLAEGKIKDLISSLNGLRLRKKEHRKRVSEVVGYFLNNEERMRYKHFRECGYFIGSGVIEGGCKHIVALRLKRSSMRWSLKGGNAILQLRICILNKEWPSFYQWHLSKIQSPASKFLPTN